MLNCLLIIHSELDDEVPPDFDNTSEIWGPGVMYYYKVELVDFCFGPPRIVDGLLHTMECNGLGHPGLMVDLVGLPQGGEYYCGLEIDRVENIDVEASSIIKCTLDGVYMKIRVAQHQYGVSFGANIYVQEHFHGLLVSNNGRRSIPWEVMNQKSNGNAGVIFQLSFEFI